MSKAFVSDDVVRDEPLALPVRPSVPQPITPRGVANLQRELASLDASTWRARVIVQILENVTPRAPALLDGGVGFGCVVTVQGAGGATRRYEIVGPDEAEPAQGRVSVSSPVARALLGQAPGTHVVVTTPKGEDEFLVVDVRLP